MFKPRYLIIFKPYINTIPVLNNNIELKHKHLAKLTILVAQNNKSLYIVDDILNLVI